MDITGLSGRAHWGKKSSNDPEIHIFQTSNSREFVDKKYVFQIVLLFSSVMYKSFQMDVTFILEIGAITHSGIHAYSTTVNGKFCGSYYPIYACG